jgi:CubicO group peptidase (beta-lactamase class C family)
MYAKKLLAVLLLVAAVATMTPARAQGGLTTRNFTFKKDAFDQSMKASLADTVKGYQYVLIKDGKMVTEGAGGWARNAADGVQTKMTTATPINVGSLWKFMTGTTMLNVMEHPGKWSPSEGQSLKSRLDYHIWGLFPAVWYNNMSVGVRGISIRQLLQHRSGFDNDFKGPRTELGFLKAGFLESQAGKREYSNINFVMLGHLIGLYENEHINADLNGYVQNNKLSTERADDYVQDQLGRRMVEIARERIWSKMTPKFSPSCNATVDFKDTAAYGYKSRMDIGKGVLTSSIASRGHCGGEGGFYLSTRDFANYMAHFSQTDLIVSKEARDMMFNDQMENPDDRLVWSSATDSQWRSYDWFRKNFGTGVIAWSNGATEGTNGVLLRLPQNHYLVLVVNSNDLKVNELFNVGADAFIAATKDNFK